MGWRKAEGPVAVEAAVVVTVVIVAVLVFVIGNAHEYVMNGTDCSTDGHTGLRDEADETVTAIVPAAAADGVSEAVVVVVVVVAS